MFVETMARLRGLPGDGETLVLCNRRHASLVREQLRQADMQAQLLLEPAGRGTAAAAALAALHSLGEKKDSVLLLFPADHWIASPEALQRAVLAGLPWARKGHIVALGVPITGVHTGYGHIQTGATLDENKVQEIVAFHEKPDAATARRYLEDGGYHWNSGIFLCSARHYLEALEKHAPAILHACRAAYDQKEHSVLGIGVGSAPWGECPVLSIDHAVMEHTTQGVLVPLDSPWSDLGSWQALWEQGREDGNGNVSRGATLLEDSHNCYVHSSKRPIATLGVRDLAIVEGAGALLVAHRERTQEVGRLAERLASQGKEERHPGASTPEPKADANLSHRPWGWFEVLLAGTAGFQVKRIVVNPGQSLSLQLHHHRSEHWVVVRGCAAGVCGEEEFRLQVGESIVIPRNTQHRLRNEGAEPLEVIEVQLGDYLGEDDIVRLVDEYGR